MNIYAIIDQFRTFMTSGGIVLDVLFIIMIVMWTLIIERLSFLYLVKKEYIPFRVQEWLTRSDRSSWFAMRVRDKMVSEFNASVNKTMPLIKSLVSVCPLLGLLGTVSGMVQVFDVMAFSGTGDARSMASGISRATIPTMAGMVGALLGVYLCSMLENRISATIDNYASQLD